MIFVLKNYKINIVVFVNNNHFFLLLFFIFHWQKGLRDLSPFAFRLSAAAAATATAAVAAVDQNDGQDDQPNPVILKQIAQTVVHSKPPRKMMKHCASQYHSMSKARKCSDNLSADGEKTDRDRGLCPFSVF